MVGGGIFISSLVISLSNLVINWKSD
jgi:hypothetical protein